MEVPHKRKTWQSVAAIVTLVLLFKVHVDGVLRYNLPVLQQLSPTNKRQVEVARNNCFRKCLGFPKGSLCPGTIAEAGCLLLDAYYDFRKRSTFI